MSDLRKRFRFTDGSFEGIAELFGWSRDMGTAENAERFYYYERFRKGKSGKRERYYEIHLGFRGGLIVNLMSFGGCGQRTLADADDWAWHFAEKHGLPKLRALTKREMTARKKQRTFPTSKIIQFPASADRGTE